MKLSRRRFCPGLWPSLITLLVLPLFLYLGFWQLDRAEQKRVLHQAFTERQDAKVLDLNENRNLQDDLEKLIWRKVSAEGKFSGGINIFLDNQVLYGSAGYFVYTPFKLKKQDIWILVNRGWLAAGVSRDKLPEIAATEEALQITGAIKSPPRTGMLLTENIIEEHAQGLIRVQKLDLASIGKTIEIELLPYVLRMSPESPAGFKRQWQAPGSGEEKHLGYAFQWFAMAAAIFLIYLILNIKREE